MSGTNLPNRAGQQQDVVDDLRAELGAEVKRAAKLEDMLNTLIVHSVERIGTTARCRHCFRFAPIGDPLNHRDGCILTITIARLAALRG